MEQFNLDNLLVNFLECYLSLVLSIINISTERRRSMRPKAFVCHASEDKDRFVISFATALRKKGIDAWLDKWEIMPGDSLVGKIFNEGIPNAQAIIVILSQNSVNKKWVIEEINASFIQRVNEGTKLIPVIIDDCDIPACLKSTCWVKLNSLNNYNNELNDIIASITGQYNKPDIGNPPKYIETIIEGIPELAQIDNLIFKLACEEALRSGFAIL